MYGDSYVCTLPILPHGDLLALKGHSHFPHSHAAIQLMTDLRLQLEHILLNLLSDMNGFLQPIHVALPDGFSLAFLRL